MPKMKTETIVIAGHEVERPVREWNGKKYYLLNHGENRARLRELAELERAKGGLARVMSYNRGWALYVGM